MVSNEDIMKELRKIRREQEGFANLIVSFILASNTGDLYSPDEIMAKTDRLINEKRVP